MIRRIAEESGELKLRVVQMLSDALGALAEPDEIPPNTWRRRAGKLARTLTLDGFAFGIAHDFPDTLEVHCGVVDRNKIPGSIGR